MASVREQAATAWIAVHPFITPQTLLLVGAVVLAGGIYCAGERSANRANASAQYAAEQRAISNSIIASNDAVRASTIVLTARVDTATTARKKFSSAASHLTIDGNAIAVDSGPPELTVPSAVVIPVLVTARAAIVSDSLAIVAGAVALHTAHVSDSLHTVRGDLAVKELKNQRSKLGYWAGVVTGVTATAALAATVIKLLK